MGNNQNMTVLLVDDDPIYSEMLTVKLQEAGFRVFSCATVAELSSLVRQRSFDFVLLDLFLAEERGIEAIPVLVEQQPFAKIFVISSRGTIDLAVDAMAKGASSFISKDKEPDEIVALLNDHTATTKSETETQDSDRLGIIGQSDAIASVIDQVKQFKDVDSTVLVTGESGTGKELVARALHQLSSRASGRFEAINCGAIPENLLESELFGHRRGAFTDAKTDKKGLFEICDNGTLFLDEVGELPLMVQVKLLRVLQEKEVLPLGATQTVKIDTRVVAATNRDLEEEVKTGRFRSDLFYRLNVLRVHLSPLRERRDDIPDLIRYFLQKYNDRFNKQVNFPTPDLIVRLQAYPWPGNIRELQNSIERGVVLSQDNRLNLEHMIEWDRLAPAATKEELLTEDFVNDSLTNAKRRFEKAYLERLLEVTKGNVTEVARIAGRYRTDIYRLLEKYNLEGDTYRPS